jgi:hypothetical protein
MNWIFTIIIFVILFGGGLLIVLKIDENDKRFTTYSLFLLVIAGIVIALYGVRLHSTNQVIFSTGKGPVAGWQLIATGVTLSIISGWFAFKNKK